MKIIKPGEVFKLHNRTFTYSVNGENIIITKNNDKQKPLPSAPSLEEVMAYFTEKGYAGADDFYRYYSQAEPPWTDKDGKPVIGWKIKARQVWFTEKRKIVVASNKSGNIGQNLVALGKSLHE